MIDLRSDTVTTPTQAMRKIIAEAEVGDDVYHDDPQVLALEEHVAGLLGKEDAMYVPTGTMSNQTALRVHTEPGDLVIAAERSHVFRSEVGAPSALSGVTSNDLASTDGTFTSEQVLAALPMETSFEPAWIFEPSTVLWIENTHNGAGGTVWPLDLIESVTDTARDAGMATHLDGARLWNASAASGVPERDFASMFDTVSVCFSKGLGAPMGSALAGSTDLISEARRFKQMFGGGFRQAGMMAAGARYAVQHHRERLIEDHDTASRLAAGLNEMPEVDIDPERVVTNMVYFSVDGAERFCQRLADVGVLLLPVAADRIRAVTHIGIEAEDIDQTVKAVGQVLTS